MGPIVTVLLLLYTVNGVPCNITGNWTSTLSPSAPSVVHIEIIQANDGSITVHATPWGSQTGTGLVANHNVSLLMVGGSEPTKGTISTSPYKDYNTGANAPDCTWLSYGWCKFPDCPIPEPNWPPWPPAPPAPPASSCALAGPCPPPNWVPTYQLNLSTVLQPCNISGFFKGAELFGLVSFDWNNAKALWTQHPRNETNCEELLVQQAQMVKAENPGIKVFVYRNMELALEWLSSERAAMYDPTKKNYFLQYQTGPKTGEIYNEPISEGDQFFWNFSVPEAVDYFINVAVLGSGGMGSPYVDGVFTDDVSGLGAEHASAASNMGLTADDVTKLQASTQLAFTQMLDALIAHHGYNWQAFSDGDGVYASPNQQNCAQQMTYLCSLSSSTPMLLSYNSTLKEQNVASFLVARGDYWWLGYGWLGCPVIPPVVDPILNLDVGTPTSACTEVSTGVFQRHYTKGVAQIDCNTFTGSLNF